MSATPHWMFSLHDEISWKRSTNKEELEKLTADINMQVASGHLSRQCKRCGGKLVNTQTPEALREGLTIFRNVARYHSFDLLMELLEWLLEH